MLSYSRELKIDRVDKDKVIGLIACSGSRTEGWLVCRCKSEYTTMMSKEGEKFDCHTPEEVGCRNYFQGTTQAYLIRKSNVTGNIIPNVPGNNTAIYRIFIWNFFIVHGKWVDVTGETLNYFALNKQKDNNTSLSISNLDLNKWRGHVVKVELEDMSCVIIKIIGTINYPVDVEMFKSFFLKPTAVTTTEIKTTTLETIATTLETIATTNITNIQHGRYNGSNKSYNTIYTIIGIAAAILAVIAVIMYRRRKSTVEFITVKEEMEEGKNIYGDVLLTNNAYLSDECDGDDHRKSVDVCRDIEHEDKDNTGSFTNADVDAVQVNTCPDEKIGTGSNEELSNDDQISVNENTIFTCRIPTTDSPEIECSVRCEINKDMEGRIDPDLPPITVTSDVGVSRDGADNDDVIEFQANV